MIKERLSQLVQDVLNGDESAAKANDILMGIKKHVNKCQKEIEDLVLIELKIPEYGSSKNIDKPGTF